jgi:hypothetical protein
MTEQNDPPTSPTRTPMGHARRGTEDEDTEGHLRH